MKKLPIGIQSFAKLREDNCVYVDKTKLIYNLLTEARQYFLSRPRRFGKSLTLSTIREIYQGNKKLFEGLWIEDKWDWTKTNPVIHIPFAKLDYYGFGLENALLELLQEIALEYGLSLEKDTYNRAFEELIKKLHEKTGRRVVILIDEYDKPIIDFLEPKEFLEKGEFAQAKENRAKLRQFYICIKDNDEHIEFFFLTGVSRFSQTGIFSHLNHLRDITTSEKYATLVGYTPEELNNYFSDYIEEVWQNNYTHLTKDAFLAQIRSWYNGYSWDAKTTVYNPYSVLGLFDQRRFQDYWFQTGSPRFLLNLMEAKQEFNFTDFNVPSSVVDSYEIEHLELRALLFQTGYLTIKAIDVDTGYYTLDFPNREVMQAFSHYIIGSMLNKYAVDSTAPILALKKAFLENKIEKVIEILQGLLRDIPATLLKRKHEDFYHALVHLHFRYLGILMESEVQTSDGRMDAVIKTPTHIYILEFKLNQTANIALQQIKDKQYAEKYLLENKIIVEIGINFDTKKRRVSDWVVG